MAYHEDLAHRVREQLAGESGVSEKAMFGGLAFLLDGNIAVGPSSGGELMVRAGPDGTDAALAPAPTRLVDMTGRPMPGRAMVAPDVIKANRQLASAACPSVPSG